MIMNLFCRLVGMQQANIIEMVGQRVCSYLWMNTVVGIGNRARWLSEI